MKKLSCLIIVLFASLASQSQGYLWAKAFGIFNNLDFGQSVDFDSHGNMYVAGFFNDSVDFDPGPGVTRLVSSWGRDMYICKYGINGQFLWAKRIGGLSHDEGSYIAIDSADNIYLTGNFGYNVDFDPGPGTAFLSGLGGTDIFIAKYDENGNYMWVKRMGGYENEFSQSISIASSGNIIISGMFQDTADFDPGPLSGKLVSYGGEDGFVANYDSNGNYLWSKGIGGNLNDVANGAAADDFGNIYVTGHFYSLSSDFDPGVGIASLTSSGQNDIFISKFDQNGNFIWAKKMGAGSYDEANAIAVSSSGDLYITGYFNSSVDFDPNAGIATLAASSQDAFLSKYDTGGNLIWAKKAGGVSADEGVSLELTLTGDIYCTGNFTSSANFSVTPAINLTAAGISDVYICKYLSSGVVSWAKGMGGTGQDYASSIAVAPGSAIGITGAFNATADFDPSASVANLVSTGPASDTFFAKYCTGVPPQPSALIGNVKVCASSNQTYSIANVNDAASYTWQLPAGWTGTSTTSVINVTVGATGGTINVRANNSCGNGVFLTTNVTVSNPSLTLSSTAIPCAGFCTSTITPIPVGGIGAYTYSPAVLTNFCAGVHSVTLTDSIGCSATANTTITGPSAVTVTTSQTNVNCYGYCYGSIIPSISGGTAPYSYSGPSTGLCAGIYTVVVTDANGCTGTTNATITEPSQIVVANSQTNVTCNGFCNGSANIIASGGIPDYDYSWMPSGGAAASITSLCAGTYTCVITDVNSCTATTTLTIIEPPAVIPNSSENSSTCPGTCTSLSAMPSGGNGGPYTINWLPSSLTGSPVTICPETTSSYTCTVVDPMGCSESEITTISVFTVSPITYVQVPSVVCISSSPVSLTAGTPGSGIYSGSGVVGNLFDPAAAGPGTHVIVYSYTDGNGCTDTALSSISVDLCTGIQQGMENEELVVYPNPFNSTIILSMTEALGLVAIYNAQGKLVYSENVVKKAIEIDLSEFPDGIYLFRIQTEERTVTKNVVKN